MICRKYITAAIFPLLWNTVIAQVNNAGNMYVPAGGYVSVWGGFTNTTTGNIGNAGNLYLHGDVASNGSTGYDAGTLYLEGNTLQTISGSSPFSTTNVVFNNASGITLDQSLSVGNTATFTAGIITAASGTAPLDFNPAGGTAIAAAGVSDEAHVNGYVRQKGMGSFTYPVGDVGHYQPIAADLTGNSDGMLCLYQAGDAGSGAFLSTGLEAVPLLHYNQEEYWELGPDGGTAAGTVTVYYDNYRNVGIGSDYATALKVAHKVTGGWQNEGGSVSGSEVSGTVTTTGNLSSWSPFALGSVTNNSPLPVSISSFTVTVKDCQAVLNWATGEESGVETFELQYSPDGRAYTALGTVAPLGPGSHYSYTTDMPARGRCFFRLCLKNTDGTYSYSQVLNVQLDCGGTGITVYPNPLRSGHDLFVRLEGYKDGATAAIYDMAGRKLNSLLLHEGVNGIPTAALAAAHYVLQIYGNNREPQIFKITVND